MNKIDRPTRSLLAAAQILAIAVLAACNGIVAGDVVATTVCHATGDAANPYESLTVTPAELATHVGHTQDIIPVPIGGCPTAAAVVIDGKIIICHATSSTANPYNEITVSANGLNGHGDHQGDLIPAPEGGCPATAVASQGAVTLTVCHATGDAANPYEQITVSGAELTTHLGHADDIMPAPAGGCPASLAAVGDGKIAICHATGSATNPYNKITVSTNGLSGHSRHEGDLIPVPEAGCPGISASASAPASEGKVTICHVTGSKTQPYAEITVDANGLNGHDKHQGDIIPAPAGGCPTSKP